MASKTQLPHVEAAYRDYLAREGDPLRGFGSDYMDYFLREQGLDEIPPQVTLPGSIPWTVAELSNMPDAFWMSAHFFAAYAQTRHTYYAAEELWDMLQEAPFPESAPVETLLKLPLPAFAIEIPPPPAGDLGADLGLSGPIPETISEKEQAAYGGESPWEGKNRVICVSYDLLSGKESTGHLELRLGILTVGRPALVAPYSVIHLEPGMTLSEGIQSAIDTIQGALHTSHKPSLRRSTAEDALRMERGLRSRMQEITSILLYLAGNDDVVKRVGHYPKLYMRHRRKMNASLSKHASEDPSESDVGIKVRQALIRYAEEKASSDEGKKRDIEPHVRRAHPHLYWTGKGRTEPIIKYLSPTLVKGGSEIKPSIQKVK